MLDEPCPTCGYTADYTAEEYRDAGKEPPKIKGDCEQCRTTICTNCSDTCTNCGDTLCVHCAYGQPSVSKALCPDCYPAS